MAKVFVFGSNLAGIHGAGAALTAFQRNGARMGQGVGRSSNSYAIPTKDEDVVTSLPLSVINGFVQLFIQYAWENQDEEFKVTQIGCGLAGFKPEEIAPMFKDAPDNCYMDRMWQPFMNANRKYWGTFS